MLKPSLRRGLLWISASLLLSCLLMLLFVAVFGWNWLRGPIERGVLEKTGRVLRIGGDITLSYAWPRPVVHVGMVTFANPPWGLEPQMLSAQAVDVAIDIPQLLWRRIVFSQVHLRRPLVFLEQRDGRKNWLLDLDQTDEDARIRIDRLTLDDGQIGYDDAAQGTSIRATLSTTSPLTTPAPGVRFSAQGRFKNQPLRARGTGGPVLGLRDAQTPYPLQLDLSVGPTALKASGTVTSLLKFSAVDMHLALRGESLAQLYAVLGIALPETRAYHTDGQLIRNGDHWRYDGFTGRFGNSDLTGTFGVDTSTKRPLIKAELRSPSLDLADLGVMIGARPAAPAHASPPSTPAGKVAPAASTSGLVLPNMKFNTDRWNTVDARVLLQASELRGLPPVALADLTVRLNLINSVLVLDPFEFTIAGGQVKGAITLDGRKDPIQAQAQLSARRMALVQLFPAAGLDGAGTGHFDGDLALAGHGHSVARMLASSNGKLHLAIEGGAISQLMMEKAGLHLWEILLLSLGGDKLVKVRCGVADFTVKGGVMSADQLMLDTEVSTIVGTGTIDLRQETLDLTLKPRTKNTSPLALRSPIYVRGTLANPDAGVDKARVAARAVGALALGLVNPLLALAPLIDAGPGRDGDCVRKPLAVNGAPVRQAPVTSKPARRQ